MALRAGYKGFKKLLPGLKIIRPGTLGIDNDVLIPELNKTFFPRSEQAVLGAKNLLPFPYYDKTTTVDDGTITVNADGSVTCDGTFTNGANFELWANANFVHDKALLFNGCPSGGEINNKYGVQIYTTAHTSNPLNDVGNGDVSIDANDTITRIVIIIRAGQVLSNLTFYPMLRLATDTDPTYVPYAMTNRELTEEVKTERLAITPETGITLSDDTKVFKKGNLVYVNFNIPSVDLAADTTTHIFTIEAKGRPLTITCWGTMVDITDGSIIRGSVGTDGKFQLRSKTAKTAHNILGSMVYMLV